MEIQYLIGLDGVPYGLDHELPNKGNVEIKLSVEQMSITAARDNETIVYDLSMILGMVKGWRTWMSYRK
ncbi:MAG: hypothetical protein ACLU93_02010 [Streptococcus sp.]